MTDPELAWSPQRTYDAAASRYGSHAERLWPWAADVLVERVGDLPPDAQVLDAGCGTGAVTRRLSALVGASGMVTGIDVSPAMLAEARRNCEALGNVSFVKADMSRLPETVADHQYHAVTAGLCINLTDNISLAMASLWGVLAPGGRAVFSVTGGKHFHDPLYDEFIEQLRGYVPNGALPEMAWTRVDTPQTLRDALLSAGIPDPSIDCITRSYPLTHPRDWWDVVTGTGISHMLAPLDESSRDHLMRQQTERVTKQGITDVYLEIVYAVIDKSR